jgi:hypothetical protein
MRQNIYLQDGQKRTTSYDQLLGKTFTVIATRPLVSNYFKIELKTETGETVYYDMSGNSEYGYPFEVIGGLTIPKEYYCEEIEQHTFDKTNIYEAGPYFGVRLRKEITPGKPDDYSLNIFVFMEHDIKPQTTGTLILENNKMVEFNAYIIAQFMDGKSFKYQFSVIPSAKEVELLKNNKILGVKIGDKVAPIQGGSKIKNVFACLVTKK